jgi:hypothetical protein
LVCDVTDVAWRRLLERWSQDYAFQRSDSVQAFLFPRGIEAVPEALRILDEDSYVVNRLERERSNGARACCSQPTRNRSASFAPG